MLKKILWVMAAILILGGSARASDATYISIKANQGQSCAWFKGSFTSDGYMRPQEEAKPWVVCELVEHVGATCRIKGHGLKGVPDVLELRGSFGIREGELAIETGRGVLRTRILCNGVNGCYQFQFWDVNDLIGYGCDMSNYIPPRKPVPQPPALLQKPNKNNEPKTAAPIPYNL